MNGADENKRIVEIGGRQISDENGRVSLMATEMMISG